MAYTEPEWGNPAYSADNADWSKTTLDFEATSAEELRAELEMQGWTVEKFKSLPAFRNALASGRYPWLKDL